MHSFGLVEINIRSTLTVCSVGQRYCARNSEVDRKLEICKVKVFYGINSYESISLMV